MQLTLDDLRKASDPLALLLGMSDSDLDRVAAEIQGKTFVTDGITNVGYIEEGRDHWTYQPTRHLGQAYRLLKLLPPECQWMAESEIGWFADPSDRGDGWAWNMKIPIPPGRGQRNRDYRRFYVSESQAGSHARAVVVLAILGLLGKDGAA